MMHLEQSSCKKKKSETVYNQEKVLTVYKKLDKHKYIYVF